MIEDTALIVDKNLTQPESRFKSWFKKWGLKIIFITLGLVVGVELVLGVKKLLISPAQTAVQLQPLTGGEIALAADKTVFKIGDEIKVAIVISTGGHPTDGTDVTVKFDPKFLEAISGSLVKGDIYLDYPVLALDGENGTVKVSGISGISGKGFNAVGDLATFKIKAKQKGKTALAVEFTKGSTTDSNMIETKTSQDILDKVTNLSLTIE